jgi:predicted RNA methylase
MPTETLEALCKRLEAYETDQWAIDAILSHELMTGHVVDPCLGKGRMAITARAMGYDTFTLDVKDWSEVFPEAERPQVVGDFLTQDAPWPDREVTYFMTPPFSKACQFVDRAFENGAYKVICFQTFTWRSSDERAAWWARNSPARIWLCIDRASCFRFDIPETCPVPERCEGKKSKEKARLCLECMNSTSTTHAYFVWERGHTGAAIINDLHKPDKPRKKP